MINSNAWTKRDYGKTLIEKILPRFDVQKVIDTSGCYLPGHGTPTLLLFGRTRPSSGSDVLAVLGKRGEREQPKNEAMAPVWTELVAHHQHVGFEGSYVSVETTPPVELRRHPWVLVGGGSRPFLRSMESGHQALERIAASIGVAVFTLEDAAFVSPADTTIVRG